MISSRHDNPRLAPCAFLLALISTAIMMLFAADGAGAASLELGAKAVPGTDSVLVKVGGARQATGVSLYVDGRLAQHDRKWPWTFGRKGRIAVGGGRHRLSVSAHLPRHVDVHRSVVVTTPGEGSGTGDSGTSSSSSSTSSPKAPTTPPKTEAPSTPPTSEAPAAGSGPLGPQESPAPGLPHGPQGSTSFASAGTLGPNLLWSGNYDTGNLSQWDLVQEAAPGRISIVPSPTEPSNPVARYEVRPEDSIGDTSPRAEVGEFLGEKEGEERWYRWYTYFPESFPTNFPNGFITFTQWRAVDESEEYSSFMVWGERLELRREGTRWSTKLTKGVWHKFVYHVKWSPDPNVGFIELFYDGQLVLPKTNVRTMGGTVADPIENYVKQGLYKAEEVPTGVLYQDGFVAGTSYEAVNNAPA